MEIQTNRLILRQHQLQDFNRFWEMINDPIAKKYTGGVTKLNYSQRLEIFKEQCEAPFSAEETEFAVIEKESGKYLGYCGFRQADEFEGNEFFYGYIQECWGKGYGVEAAKETLSYLFKQLPHEQYMATVHLENIGSIKILTKLGFKESTQHEIDATQELKYYVINKSDFMKAI